MSAAIVAINVLIFYLYNMSLNSVDLRFFQYTSGVIPYELTHRVNLAPSTLDYPVTLFSSMFVHANMGHIFANMLMLLLCGPKVEMRVGRRHFLVMFVAAGIISALAHTYAYPNSVAPLIGASGAISGILGAAFILFSTSRIFIFVWFASQFFVDPNSSEAWVAHVGGFVSGIVLVNLLYSPKREAQLQAA